MTFKQYLKIHLPGAMKMEKGKKRLCKKKAKKDLFKRWELLEEIRLIEDRQLRLEKIDEIPYKRSRKPKDDYFSSLLMGSAMDAIADAFCSIPRLGYPALVPKS